MIPKDVIAIDPEVRGGTPVFKGTDVPVKTLFEHLKRNHTRDEFLKRFPAVTRQMVNAMLDQVGERFA